MLYENKPVQRHNEKSLSHLLEYATRRVLSSPLYPTGMGQKLYPQLGLEPLVEAWRGQHSIGGPLIRTPGKNKVEARVYSEWICVKNIARTPLEL